MKDIQFHNNIKNEFIKIKNSVENNEININGPIGGDSIFDYGYSFQNFKDDISKIEGKIVVNIKSYGGSLFEAFAIYDFIRSLKNNVTTKIIGSSASAATIISLAGDKRLISKNSRYLIHKPSVMAAGNSDDFKKIIEQLEDLDKQLVDIYVERTNLNAKGVIDLMNREEFISSEKALEYGFVDGIIEEKSTNKPKNNDKTEVIKEAIDNFLNEKNTNIMELIDNLTEKEENTPENVEETPEKVEETTEEETTKETATEEVTNEEVETPTEEVENKKDDDEEEKENKDDDEEEDKDKIIEDLKKEIDSLKKKLAKNEVDEAEEKAMEIVNFLDEAINSGKIKEESRDEWMNVGIEQGIAVLKTLMTSIPENKASTEKLRDVITKSDSFKGKEDILNQWKNGKIDTETYLKLVKNTK